MNRMNMFEDKPAIEKLNSYYNMTKSDEDFQLCTRVNALVVFEDNIVESGSHFVCTEIYLKGKGIDCEEMITNHASYVEGRAHEYTDTIMADIIDLNGRLCCIIHHQLYIDSPLLDKLIKHCRLKDYRVGLYYYKNDAAYSYWLI